MKTKEKSEAKAGRRRSRLFELPPEENPEVKIESLHDLREDITDEDTFKAPTTR